MFNIRVDEYVYYNGGDINIRSFFYVVGYVFL